MCRQKMSILFNEIWINEEMLPKCTHTHTYIYVYICMEVPMVYGGTRGVMIIVVIK